MLHCFSSGGLSGSDLAKWLTRILVPLSMMLLGLWLAKQFWPTVETIREEADYIPQKVLLRAIPTRVVHKWHTRLWDWTTTVETDPAVVTVYEETVDEVGPSMLYVEKKGSGLLTDVYKPDSLSLTSYKYEGIRNDFKLYFDPDGKLHLKQNRNLFDRPSVELGYLANRGFYVRSQMRIWKLYPTAEVEEGGLRYGVAVKF